MRRNLAGWCALLLAAGCSTGAGGGTGGADNGAVCKAYSAAQSHVEVLVDGKVARLLGSRPGVRSPHEGFILRIGSPCSMTIRVESNEDFTGPIPLHDGEAITVRGEYEYYARGGVIHWTHRDPRGRHPGGFVQADGRLYQ